MCDFADVAFVVTGPHLMRILDVFDTTSSSIMRSLNPLLELARTSRVAFIHRIARLFALFPV